MMQLVLVFRVLLWQQSELEHGEVDRHKKALSRWPRCSVPASGIKTRQGRLISGHLERYTGYRHFPLDWMGRGREREGQEQLLDSGLGTIGPACEKVEV